MSDDKCQAVDLVPTEDDAIAVECGRPGRRVYERLETGGSRTRIACDLHAIGYDDVN